jgi:hypothetical protein
MAGNPVRTSADISGEVFTHYLKYNPATSSLSNYPVRGGDDLQCTAVLRASDPAAHGITRSVDRITVRDVHPPSVVRDDNITSQANIISVEFEVRETW